MDRSFARIAQKPRKTSRREVLKLGATVAAGTALAGVKVPWVHAAEANTIRLALIGCGGRGCGAVGDAFSVADGPVKLYAMADLTEDRVQRRTIASWQSSFLTGSTVPPNGSSPASTPTARRSTACGPATWQCLRPTPTVAPRQLEYAVKKGVNVFMEKSFAPDPAGCRRILVAGQEAAKRRTSRSPPVCSAATASPGRR